MFTAAGHWYVPCSELPAATAAATDVTFHVDPGAYWPCVARLRIGSPLAWWNSRRNWVSVIPPDQMRGLYVG